MARPQWQIDGMKLLRERLPTFPDNLFLASKAPAKMEVVEIDTAGHKLSFRKVAFTAGVKLANIDPKIHYTAVYWENNAPGDVVNLWVRFASDVDVNRRAMTNAIDGLFRDGFTTAMRQQDGYP